MSRLRSLALLALVAAAGCPRGDGRAMVHIPPPRSWEQGLVQHRARRDDLFRNPAETPLLPEDRASFGGLDYWKPDPRYYFAGDLQLRAEPERFTIATTAGGERPCERYGWVGFSLDRRSYVLQVYRLLDMPADSPGSLLLPFIDGTAESGETYPAGRYVDLLGPAGGPYVLDFNMAYNPSCASGDPRRFACPATPRENRLPALRIEAGERSWRR